KVRHQVTPPEPLGLLHRWLANRTNHSATPGYHYSVDCTRLLDWWAKQSQNYGQLPLALEMKEAVFKLPTGRRSGQKGLIDESEKAQLMNLSTLNQYGLYGQTSEDVPTEEGAPKESEPVSASAAERAPK